MGGQDPIAPNALNPGNTAWTGFVQQDYMLPSFANVPKKVGSEEAAPS